MKPELEPVIGLEVHVQLGTATKLFCGCSTQFGSPPNTNVCPVCTGQPGVLPVLNEQAVLLAIKVALATNCTIRRRSRFARKNYFYPDLPKGYQISQHDEPIAEHGCLELWRDEQLQRVPITRIHLEEDAGKTIHQAGGVSLVDLNRACVPLIEIVSEPAIHSPADAAEYMRALRAVVRTLGVSDGNMEQGSLRCDANISLRPVGQDTLGTKVEIKNLNSFRFVQKALEFEIERQSAILARGEAVVQETRLYESDTGVTRSMRSKEEAHDYRYFPEPDLPPIEVSEALIEGLRETLPELPVARRRRLAEQYAISGLDAAELTREPELADYFEATVKNGAQPKRAAGWIRTELLSRLDDARDAANARVSARDAAELLALVDAEIVSGTAAKRIFSKMWETGGRAEEIARAEDLFQQSDAAAIEQAVRELLASNPDKVAQFRSGKGKVLGWFVGQLMRATAGKANPALVSEILRKQLESGAEEA